MVDETADHSSSACPALCHADGNRYYFAVFHSTLLIEFTVASWSITEMIQYAAVKLATLIGGHKKYIDKIRLTIGGQKFTRIARLANSTTESLSL